jgi:hypothetical protein
LLLKSSFYSLEVRFLASSQALESRLPPEFFQLGAIGHVHGGLIPILGSDGSDGESEDQKVVDFMGVLKTQNWNHCLGT